MENKEKNIRYTLKEIYEQYTNVTDMIFTTFNFEPDFFEEHVITFLMGSDKKISTVGELNATNEWIREHGVSIYYDQGALISGSSCITLPVYPQYIETGVFHPKVVVLHGFLQKNNEPATHLIVSSCNLTVAGYGRNQEAFSCIKVESSQVANSLLEFLNTISGFDDKRHTNVKDYLRIAGFPRKSGVEFFWNYGKKGEWLVNRISRMPKGNLTVLSPYFDEDGPETLLKDIRNIEKKFIIPALDNEKYNIYREDYLNLKAFGVMFFNLVGDENNKRFVHAKIIAKGSFIVVGSYNFTTAALKGLNAEAALIFCKTEHPLFLTTSIDEDKFLARVEPIINRDTLDKECGKIFVSITVDWKKDIIIIDADIADKESDYYVKVDGMNKSPEWNLKYRNENNRMIIPLSDDVIRGLLRHKQFSVYKDNVICFKGLFNEINWEGIRPEIVCESLDETLAEWYLGTSGKNVSRPYELRCITIEDADTEKIIGSGSDPSADIFDNYYMVCRALGNMIIQVEKHSKEIMIPDPSKRECPRRREWRRRRDYSCTLLYKILFSHPGSIAQMLKFLEKNEQEREFDVVYGWLICRYLTRIFTFLPQSIDGMPVFEEKYKIVEKQLKQLDSRLMAKIKADCNPKYLNWIEAELFRNEES